MLDGRNAYIALTEYGTALCFNNVLSYSLDNRLAFDQSRKPPLFSKFFRDCSGTAADSVSGQLDLDSYINYDEWKKN